MSTQPDSTSLALLLALQELLAATVANEGADMTDALPQALLTSLQAVGAERGLLLLNDGQAPGPAWHAAAGEVLPLSPGEAHQAALTARRATGAEEGHPLPSLGTGVAGNTLYVPIWDGQTLHGTLGIAGEAAHSDTAVLPLQLCAGLLAQALSCGQAQEARRTAAQREEEQQRLRDDLAAMLVHDLQGPLGNIVASLEMASEAAHGADWVALPSLLEIALHSGHQLRTLVDSVLDLSRLEAGQPLTERAPTDVLRLIQDSLSIIEPELEVRDVRVILEVAPGIPPVDANAPMMRRVLLNLLDNALKASRSGQDVRIRAATDRGAAQALFGVIDRGAGVPAADRERIFDKFQRLDQSGESKGLGLGLAFCRLAVQAHDGRIWVDETPGGGASFFFTLPLATSQSA